jgi:hypothetical protein
MHRRHPHEIAASLRVLTYSGSRSGIWRTCLAMASPALARQRSTHFLASGVVATSPAEVDLVRRYARVTGFTDTIVRGPVLSSMSTS